MYQDKDFIVGESSVPSPGGGTFEGPGGMAPPFAPGGPLDPISPVTTEQYMEAFQPGFIGSGAPGSGAGAPLSTPYPTAPFSAAGGVGMVNPGLPGHGTTPGRFQPGGGVQLPQAGQLPSQRPGSQRDPGFLARIVPVSGDVSRIIPVSGTGGPETQPPTVGGGPIMPPNRPGQRPPNPDLPPGTVEPPIVIPPAEGGGPTQGKPKGLKTLPPPAGATPPTGPPKPPGQWVTLDAGRGQPPAWAFVEATGPGTDDGLEGVPTPKPAGTGTTPKPPMAGAPPSTGGEKGHYVPIQMPYVSEWAAEREDPDDVVWAWVPTIDDSYGVKAPEPPTTPQPK